MSYVGQRKQFGRPVGSFQAVKHKLANLLIEVEQAKSASYFAAREAASEGSDLALAASLAKAYTGDAFFHTAADNIQIHGGIGFTWEHPAHLFLKRAKSGSIALGTPDRHRSALASLVDLPGPGSIVTSRPASL